MSYRKGNLADFTRGVKMAFPLTIALTPLAILFGSQSVSQGLPPAHSVLMSIANYGVSAQMVGVDLWQKGAPLLMIILATFLINSRHILMSAALAPWLHHVPMRKVLVMLFLMSDETWALVLDDINKRKVFSVPFWWGEVITLYGVWIVMTYIGTFTGKNVVLFQHYGLDMALPAMFLVILRDSWKNHFMTIPWIVSVITGSFTYLMVPGIWYVLGGIIPGCIASWFMAKKVKDPL